MPTQDPRHLLRRALVGFGERVAGVSRGDWDQPSPCEDWSVRDLVAHVVEEERFGPPLLAGQTLVEIGDRFSGDLLGDHPLDVWRDAAADLRDAIADPAVLEAPVRLPGSPRSGQEFLLELFADHLVHTWDLARAVGGDEELPRDLVEACAAWFDAHEQAWREAGEIGPPSPVPADADRQTVLLARFGRDATTTAPVAPPRQKETT